jgi:GNAT superfamily N-acetyltransferase
VRDLPKEDRFFFAVEDDQVLGYAHVRVARDIARDEAAEVATLLVRKPHRRRGVGKRLITAAEAWALESGRAQLFLRSQVGQKDLHAFSVALGYEEKGTSLAFARDLRPARRSEAPTQRL